MPLLPHCIKPQQMPCLGQMLNTMAFCVPPYMPGYPGSILHGRAMCILMCLAYMLSSCLYPCCLLAGMVYATSAIPVTFAIAVMYAVPETAAIPIHAYPFWNILGWHGIFYKCMPITMPGAPGIYANFMLFLLLLLLLLFIDLQGCCYSFLCMPIVISAAICIYANFMLLLLLLLHNAQTEHDIK